MYLIATAFLPQYLFIVELYGIDALVLLAGRNLLLVNKVEKIGIYIFGRNQFQTTTCKINLKIPEVRCIYPYRVVAVSHLFQFLQESSRKFGAHYLFLFGGFYDLRIINESLFYISLEKIRKNEAIDWQVCPVVVEHALFFRQQQSYVITAEFHFYILLSPPCRKSKRYFLSFLIYFHVIASL